jgi:tetratricopeptide (TPR) repeat protein
MERAEKFEQALQLLEAGAYETALREFKELAEKAEDEELRADYIYGQLQALMRLGRTDEARKLLHIARQSFGDTDEAHARGDLIQVQLDSLEGKWESVLPLLNHMVKRYGDILRHPQVRDVYEEVELRRGMLLAHLGRFREALPLLEECLNFTGPLITSHLFYELGRCYVDAGDLDRARSSFTRAFGLGLDEVRTSSAHFNLGRIHMRNEAYAKALTEFELAEAHADAAKTSKKSIYKAMSVSYDKLGQAEKARTYLELASKT